MKHLLKILLLLLHPLNPPHQRLLPVLKNLHNNLLLLRRILMEKFVRLHLQELPPLLQGYPFLNFLELVPGVASLPRTLLMLLRKDQLL